MRSRVLSVIVASLSMCVVYSPAWGYANAGPDGGPHRKINEFALKQFIAQSHKDEFFSHYDFYPAAADYGLKLSSGEHPFVAECLTVTQSGDWYKSQVSLPPMFTAMPTYIEEDSTTRKFAWWIVEGGYTADEPESYMALRHFFDPTRRAIDPQDNNKSVDYLTDALDPWVSPRLMGANPRMNAGKWATDKSPYSYSNGQDALTKALSTTPGVSEKPGCYGKAWRSLGETMHLLADMTVPAHVRNDAHPGAPLIKSLKADPYEAWATAEKVSECAKSPLNAQVGKLIESAKDDSELFKLIARLTNSCFFSADTISGTDGLTHKHVTNTNKQPEYDTPKLDDYKFEPGKDGVGGYYVSQAGKLCAYRAKDGTHTVNSVIAEGQGKDLIPIAIAADAKLISLYMPRVKLSMDSFDAKSNIAKCRATAYTKNLLGELVPDKMMGNPSCGGKAIVFATFAVGKKNYLLPMQSVNAGEFTLDLGSVISDARKSPDKSGTCTASCAIGLDMGGVVVKSDPVVVLSGKNPPQLKPTAKPKAPVSRAKPGKFASNIMVSVNVGGHINYSTGEARDTYILIDNMTPARESPDFRIKWSGNTFTLNYKRQEHHSGQGYYHDVTSSITGTISSDGSKLLNVHATLSDDSPFGGYTREIKAQNVPRISKWDNALGVAKDHLVYRINGPSVKNSVQVANETVKSVTRDGYKFGQDSAVSSITYPSGQGFIEIQFFKK